MSYTITWCPNELIQEELHMSIYLERNGRTRKSLKIPLEELGGILCWHPVSVLEAASKGREWTTELVSQSLGWERKTEIIRWPIV